jgi:hypothetical protein
MSWNNVLPWWIFNHILWEQHALQLCAMPGEFHVSEFHDYEMPPPTK